jgi:prophage antirepressor-like protein
MNNDVKVFNFNSFDVQVITDEQGEPWFLAKDVAAVLEYSDTQALTRRLDDDEVKTYPDSTSGQVRNVSIINESGLYSSVLGSKKPEAKEFKKWVTSEVLPSIRKTGQYGLKQTLTPAEMFAQSAQLLLEQERKINQTAQDVKQLESKVSTMQIDLRNGVPFGCISKSNAWRVYGSGLGEKVFNEAMSKLDIPTQNYVHHGEGFSRATYAYQEDRIPTAIKHFISDLEQTSPCKCYSKLLNKPVMYKKPQTITPVSA